MLTFECSSDCKYESADSATDKRKGGDWYGHGSGRGRGAQGGVNVKLRAYEMTTNDIDGLPYADPTL